MAWWMLAGDALAAGGSYLPGEATFFQRGQSFLGLFALVGIAWALSLDRWKVDWRVVAWGMGLQFTLGVLMLSQLTTYITAWIYPLITSGTGWVVPPEGLLFVAIDTGVNRLLSFAGDGATFVFSSVSPHQILDPTGQPVDYPAAGISPPVKTFAFWVLPTIVFFSSLMSLLYYLGAMQFVIKGIAWAMVRTLGTSGAESLSAAGNIFVGQTEAPLLIRPFVKDMTRSELMAVMVGGFATASGGVLGAYVSFLGGIPNIAGHLVMAAVLAAPASLAIAKVMVPETGVPKTRGEATVPEVPADQRPANAIEAVARGASDGMGLAINVAAMLIAIVALVALLNWAVGMVPITWCTTGEAALGYTCGGQPGDPLTLSMLLGWAFSPIAFLMGIPWSESVVIGGLLGEKIVLTEFVAFINLGSLTAPGAVPVISERSAVIASYAMCGFANFASIGIQIGGIGGLAPERTGDLARLGLRAMFGGMLVSCMNGAVAGIFL